MRVGLRLSGLAAGALMAGAAATAAGGDVGKATPTIAPTMRPLPSVQSVAIPNGEGPVGGGGHDRSHCPGDDYGDHFGDDFGDAFGDCYWCCR